MYIDYLSVSTRLDYCGGTPDTYCSLDHNGLVQKPIVTALDKGKGKEYNPRDA
jgi:hypothetical protein